MVLYGLTTPQNHSEAEDVYDFARRVEQGSFSDQAGVNRVLALPIFGVAYKSAQTLGYSGRAFPFMIFVNRVLAVFCVYLFWRLISGVGRQVLGVGSQNAGGRGDSPPNACCLMPIALLFAFSYGFWRYANEAETYILASVLVLGAWCLAVKSVIGCPLVVDCGSSHSTRSVHDAHSIFRISHAAKRNLAYIICTLLSSVGILVHLLNLIPLLLIIPLYYLLSGKWKMAIIHGVVTGVLVVAGYSICSPWLDWREFGAHHHALEGGLGLKNLVRGGIAFGQCLISGNFLFGFDSFQNLLVNLFPSRMLEEEFFMGRHMPGWIKWAGCVTLGGFAVCSLWFGVVHLKAMLRKETLDTVGLTDPNSKLQTPNLKPLTWSALIWFILYAIAVIYTEAGSPELWIMALIPFWLMVASLLAHRANATIQGSVSKSGRCSVGSVSRIGWIASPEQSGKADSSNNGRCRVGFVSRIGWILVFLLFLHNLIGGLWPVMSKKSDYHAAKGRWLVEHTTPDDIILTDYEPVMIFYLNYYSPAQVINSGSVDPSELQKMMENAEGGVYAVDSFFHPMESMRVRSPELYKHMLVNGQELSGDFVKVVDDAFGGVWKWGDKQ